MRSRLVLDIKKIYEMEKEAQCQCMMARDAFIFLMALCSYFIFLQGASTTWNQKLVDLRMVHPEWAQNLGETPVADFSVERVGTIRSPHSNVQWASDLCMLIAAKVPVWIFWSKHWQY